MASRKNFTPTQVDEMVRLAREEGRSLYYIARMFHTTAPAVRYHLRKRGVRTGPEPDSLRVARERTPDG